MNKSSFLYKKIGPSSDSCKALPKERVREIIEDLTQLLSNKDGPSKDLIGLILARISEGDEVAETMRSIGIEAVIGQFLNQNRFINVDKESKKYLAEIEGKVHCIKTAANILSQPEEVKNKVNIKEISFLFGVLE